MYVSRAIRGLNVNYEEDSTIELFHDLSKLNLVEKYQAKLDVVVTESVYDEAAKFACKSFDKFVCTDINKHTIYVYRHNMWKLDHGLRYLVRDLVNFSPRSGSSHKHRSELIKDVCHHLYNESFIANLGEYKAINLCGTSFDFVSGEYRPGIPSDYTSISTDYPVQDDYRTEIEKMIRDIFPDDDIYKYFMRFCGSLLIPGNRDKLFMVWSGTGNNGKSVLARLIELTLGEYSVKLPTSLVTGRRGGSSSATPEMVIMEKKLIAFLQEPGHNERLNIGVVKELTGNDTLYVRGLYENARRISVKAKVVYIVNSTDNLAVMEDAAWNRIVVLPFLTHFTDKPMAYNERKKDLYLNDKLKKYAGSFLSLMIDEAREYMKYGLIDSETVKKTTKQVKIDNDPIGIYLESDMDKAYTSFCTYMKQFVPNEIIPNAKEYEKRKTASSPVLR
ncbi:hypothetical protein INT43_004973 [Umbelopsis isabellina]|uniref:SF3 helicase domain-containing protein n=1 Tax=Mortierella isabellina TaxID=91625 RepID=A0A8H7U6Y4_MORIS|nr:hypothetical protein INT43_004973 [Umbelopsis isabellina]